MNVTERSLFNLDHKSFENTLMHQYKNNKEISLKPGAAKHNFKNNSPQEDGVVNAAPHRCKFLKSETLVNSDGCHG